MKRVAGCWLVLLFFKSVPAQTPNLVLPVGHTSSVSSVAFSPDAKFVITASWDNTAKIWLAPEGRLLLDLKRHTGSLTSARFSTKGSYVVTTSKDSTAIIWRARDGKPLHSLKGHRDWVTTAVFDNNDSIVVTASWDNTLRAWDVKSGKLLHVLTGHTAPINTIVFSPDGKYLLSSAKDSIAILWLSSTGKMVHRLSAHIDWVNKAVFNRKGDMILTASKDGTVKSWSTVSGKVIRSFSAHAAAVNDVSFDAASNRIITASDDNTCIIWDTHSGNKLQTLSRHHGPVTCAAFGEGNRMVTAGADGSAIIWNENGSIFQELKGHSAAVTHMEFDYSGKYVATAAMDNSARIWRMDNTKSPGVLIGHTSVVTSAAYSLDGNYLVTASWDNTAKIWNASDGKLLSNLKGHTDWINTAAFSDDGKLVVTASSDNTARIWNVPDGSLVRILEGHSDWIGSAIFSADRQFVITTSWDNTSRIFNIETGSVICELKGHTDYVKWVNFSHNGRLVVTASADNTARIWEVPSGRLLHELSGHTDKVRTAEFTADDLKVVTSSYDSTARIWDVSTGKTLLVMKGHTASLNSAMINPAGGTIATTSMDNTARIWNINDGRLLHILALHKHSINSGHYSRDGKRMVLGSWDNTASIWNTENGKLLFQLKGHEGPIKSATFSPDRKFVITTSEDNTLKKWNAESGEFLYTFFAVDSSDYLAIDRYGHYDGSENARKQLYYVCDNEIIDLEQFKDLSWEPNLVSKLIGLNREPVTAKRLDEISLCNYTPVVEEKGSGKGTFRYHIRPRGGGLGEVQLFVNDKLVYTYLPKDLLQQKGEYILSLDSGKISTYLMSGQANQLVVKATTRRGLMVSRGAAQTINSSKKPVTYPDMYVVAVGVSDYKGDKLKLKYASKDAVDFSAALSASAEKLLNGDGKQHVFTYTINTESDNPRRPLKKQIVQLIDTIAKKASSDDIIVIFFAGHGVLQAGQKTFYLLTAEASQPDLSGVEKEVAISTDELREWLRSIRANKQLLVLDACNSGQVISHMQEYFGKRSVPADQQRALENLKDKTGTFILCASASGQAAYESSLYGQGLLTYSLLSGLKFGNGLRDNKFIDVTRWFNYACDNVKLMAREIGGRQDPQIIGNASFEIGIVDRDVINKISLANRKQVFRSSRFIQDEDLLNDELDFSLLVDRELNNTAATAKVSPWVFVADNPFADAYTIRGKYEIQGKQLNVKVSVFKGQKDRLHQFEVSGLVDKREDLAAKIVDITRIYMNQLAKSQP